MGNTIDKAPSLEEAARILHDKLRMPVNVLGFEEIPMVRCRPEEVQRLASQGMMDYAERAKSQAKKKYGESAEINFIGETPDHVMIYATYNPLGDSQKPREDLPELPI